MELSLRTSARQKIKPTLYTPAKYENFRLNKKKALDKKIEQCQMDIEVVLVNKHGIFFLELSGGAYELLKIAIDEYFHGHEIYKLDPNLRWMKKACA